MFRFDAKLYIILVIILAILFILILVLPYGKQGQQQTISPSVFPTPTLIQLNMTKAPTPLPKPTSTGGQEEIPQNVENYAIQKQNLRRKTPLSENGFTITYDYANDQFTVTSQPPGTNHQSLFQAWLKQNYPLIPLDKFTFK